MLPLPRCHPLRAFCVQLLARAKLVRYTLSEQQDLEQDDLEESTFRFTEAIFLTLPCDTSPGEYNIVQIFYSLALAVLLRAEVSKQAKDVTWCITYLRYLRGQWPEISIDLKDHPVTTILVYALAVQVELEPEDVDQDIEEMADLCDELLSSDISIKSLDLPIMALASAVWTCQSGSFRWEISSEKAIKCLQKAAMRLPDLHFVSIVLAIYFLSRFYTTPLDNNYQEGMAIVNKLITLHDPGDSPYRQNALGLAFHFAEVQYHKYGKPEHVENVIYRARVWLDGTSLDHPDRPVMIGILTRFQGFRSFGLNAFADSIESSRSSPFESAKFPSFQDLTAELSTVKSLPRMSLWKHRDALTSDFEHLTDIAEIEHGIKYCRQLLASYPDSQLVPLAHQALPDLLYRAFQVTNEIEYLNNTISAARDHIDSMDLPTNRFALLGRLELSLSTRLRLLDRREDLNELMEVFAMMAKYKNTDVDRRFPVSSVWASIAHVSGHPSAATAYEHAMSEMQASLTFVPTLENQHSQLIAMHDEYKTLGSNYASYQVRSDQLKQAIETLERGRVLLWSEMRGFRTPIPQIRLADPHLADKFTAVNNDLETLTFIRKNLKRQRELTLG
jgi:hypothetical protein